MAQHAVRIVQERRRDRRIRVLEVTASVLAGGQVSIGRVGLHVQPVQGEIDRGVYFARRLGLGGGEALEVDVEDLRQARDADLLGRLALALAHGALPLLVAGQHLLGAVASQAIREGATSASWYLDAEGVEGLIRGGGVAAGRAAQPRRVLSREDTRDERPLPMGPALPLRFGHDVYRHTFPVQLLLYCQRPKRCIVPSSI